MGETGRSRMLSLGKLIVSSHSPGDEYRLHSMENESKE